MKLTRILEKAVSSNKGLVYLDCPLSESGHIFYQIGRYSPFVPQPEVHQLANILVGLFCSVLTFRAKRTKQNESNTCLKSGLRKLTPTISKGLLTPKFSKGCCCGCIRQHCHQMKGPFAE